ncbi:hypothetical protein CKO13_10335 [Halorhodospira neutriphila]|uniref:Outer membrane protein beta-barrel domain-containing protein n=1 Tax=Halorhodospira neutriphila TaxID=168379 RepID=A0ABS1EC03_9GAMM|nr:hypothetical protein [Halorhodospira neutriphila]
MAASLLLWSGLAAAQVTQAQRSGWTYAETSTGQELYFGANALLWNFSPQGDGGPEFSDVGWGGLYGIRLGPNLSIENRLFVGGRDQDGGTEAELDGAVSSLFRLTFYQAPVEAYLLGGFTAYNFELSDQENTTLFRPSVGAGVGTQLFPYTWLYAEVLLYSAGGEDEFAAAGGGIQLRFGQ